ncbi:MAG: hypothetical protein ACRBBP_00555 [Bdellovibrionales bacterium]
MKDKVFVCQRCQVRLEKVKDFKGVSFQWSAESFKELKLQFLRLFNQKPAKKVVLTSCLGYCPEGKISFEETEGGVLKGESSYSPDLNREDVFKLLFK